MISNFEKELLEHSNVEIKSIGDIEGNYVAHIETPWGFVATGTASKRVFDSESDASSMAIYDALSLITKCEHYHQQKIKYLSDDDFNQYPSVFDNDDFVDEDEDLSDEERKVLDRINRDIENEKRQNPNSSIRDLFDQYVSDHKTLENSLEVIKGMTPRDANDYINILEYSDKVGEILIEKLNELPEDEKSKVVKLVEEKVKKALFDKINSLLEGAMED